MIRLFGCFVFMVTAAFAQDAVDAAAAKLRVLDKLTGEVTDVTLARGETKTVGRITVQMDGCRYYPDSPAAEAFVHLTILDAADPNPIFNGWMTASSPALSALDHPRYDVWPLRCDVADIVLPDVEEAAPEDNNAATDGNGG